MDIHNQRILITGANGFIGGRLAERLAQEEGARVRGLVRRAGATLRGRPAQGNHTGLPLQATVGDITDPAAITAAVRDCDAVVHCAAMQGARGYLRDFRRVNVQGTLDLLRAAKDAGVARFVHLSTINVHGYPPPRDANADSPLAFTGDFYSISKAEGERAAWEFFTNYHLPITIIRPACTYGPRSQAWTLAPIQRLRRGAPVLIGKGDGMCNAVYIDNLIDLILLAFKNDAAIGQAFIGAEGRGVTWREFYGAYAQMVGIPRVNAMPRGFAFLAAMGFEAIARVTGRGARIARASVEFYSHKVVFDIEKSKRLLGYAPRVSFEEGMEKTRRWLIADGIMPAK